MRYHSKITILSFLFFAVMSPALPAAGAETVYVSDQLVISLRQEKASAASILMNLKTGTPLEVLAAEGDYLKVRTADGAEGFVLRRYITDQTPAPIMIKELQEKLAKLEAERAGTSPRTKTELEERLEKAKLQYEAESSRQLQQLEEVKRNLEEKEKERLAAAAAFAALQAENGQTVQTVAERDRLQQENSRLNLELKELRQASNQIQSFTRIFFTKELKLLLAGGGLFFLGWFIGRVRRKQRNRF